MLYRYGCRRSVSRGNDRPVVRSPPAQVRVACVAITYEWLDMNGCSMLHTYRALMSYHEHVSETAQADSRVVHSNP